MLVAAAVCPHPPLLVPDAIGAAGLFHDREWFADPERRPPFTIMEGGDDSRIPELRAACGAAVAGLAAALPDLIVVVGGADESAEYAASAAGSLRTFGVPFTTGSGEPVLPLSLTVGGWLLRRFLLASGGVGGAGGASGANRVAVVGGAESVGTGSAGGGGGAGAGGVDAGPWRLRLRAVRRSMPTAACLRLGAELAGCAPRVALLVMGDGSARRVAGGHGAADPAAQRYDAEVAAALADADPGRLARLDATLDDELMIAGRAAWQVLAGAADGRDPRGQLRFAAAPLGVGYLVASWAS